MRAAVLLFPGLNREGDAMRALEQASGVKPTLVWHAEHDLPSGTDLVVVPGGFSYGDYLRCGAIAGRANIMHAVRAHAERGGLVLGICNGFQILCESGLLPGVLMRNKDLRFVCRMQHLRGKVLEPEGSGIDQFSRKGDLVLRCSLGVKVKLYFEIRCRQRPGVDVDGDADLRLCVLAQRLRSVRVLET